MKSICKFMLMLILLHQLSLSSALADSAYPRQAYQSVDADRIRYQMPDGISLTNKTSQIAGELTVEIDAANSKWGIAVSSSLNEGNQIPMALYADAPTLNGQKPIGQKNTNVRIGKLSVDEGREDAYFSEFDKIIATSFQKYEIGDTDYRNERSIASYDMQSETLLPTEVEAAHLIAWYYEGQDNPVYEYYFLNVAYTSDSAIRVPLTKVESTRIFPQKHESLTISKSAGSLSYEVSPDSTLIDPNPDDEEFSILTTFVKAPDVAKSYVFKNAGYISPVQQLEYPPDGDQSMKGARLGMGLEHANTQTFSLTWYSSDDGSGDPILTEFLSIDIHIGAPGPFPRYVSELASIPSGRVWPLLRYGDEYTDSDFVFLSYGEDDDFDIVRRYADPRKIAENEDPTEYRMALYVVPYEGATAYSITSRSSHNIYGQKSDYYNNSFKPDLLDPKNRKTIQDAAYSIDDTDVIRLKSDRLFQSKTFSHDPDLIIYTETETSTEFAGHVFMIYWYKDITDSEPIKKEYLIIKTDPFSVTTTQEAFTDESQLPSPSNMLLPVIVLADEDAHQSRRLFLAIENHVYAGKNCVVYGLHVQDEFGRKVDLQKDATIILPYPKGMGMGSPGSFTLNHYDENKGLIHYSEDSADPRYRLTRIPHGISFKNQTFSPFILSWEELPEDSAAALPKTGDSSAPLFLMTFLLAFSLLGFARLRRSRA